MCRPVSLRGLTFSLLLGLFPCPVLASISEPTIFQEFSLNRLLFLLTLGFVLFAPSDGEAEAAAGLNPDERRLYEELKRFCNRYNVTVLPKPTLHELFTAGQLHLLPVSVRENAAQLSFSCAVRNPTHHRPMAVIDLEPASPGSREVRQKESVCKQLNLPYLRVRAGDWKRFEELNLEQK